MTNGSAIRTGACLLWSANPRGSRIDLARQFALRLQLSANTHEMPEVRPVRPKKRSALINYSPTPDVVMIMFVGTCAITFGIGATLTGLAITLTEGPDTTPRE